MDVGLKAFLRHAVDRACVLRSLKVALVVGTLLALINHYDTLFSGTWTTQEVVQILLTYLVPYGVATFGAAMQALHLERQKASKGREETSGCGGFQNQPRK